MSSKKVKLQKRIVRRELSRYTLETINNFLENCKNWPLRERLTIAWAIVRGKKISKMVRK